MSSTIVFAPTARYAGTIRKQDTVITTVRAIGVGAITAPHVLWAINSQLECKGLFSAQLTLTDVRRILTTMAQWGWLTKHGPDFFWF